MSDAVLAFAGGTPRSGLTLLRALLDTHPRIACGPDIGLLPAIASQWSDLRTAIGRNLATYHHLSEAALRQRYAELVAGLFEPLRRATGAMAVVEKTSANVLAFERLHALLPDAPLVHVIRDGRDVAASLLDTGWRNAAGRPLPYVADPRHGARLWTQMVTAGRRAGAVCGDRYLEIRYEALVRDPRSALTPLLAQLGLGWDDAMLDFHRRPLVLTATEAVSAGRLAMSLDAASIGRARRRLPPAEHAAVEREAGPLLKELGYI